MGFSLGTSPSSVYRSTLHRSVDWSPLSAGGLLFGQFSAEEVTLRGGNDFCSNLRSAPVC